MRYRRHIRNADRGREKKVKSKNKIKKSTEVPEGKRDGIIEKGNVANVG